MKYVKYHFSNGYCDCEYDNYWKFEDGYYTDEEVDNLFCNELFTYGENYEYIIEGDTIREYEVYYKGYDICGYWKYVTEEEYRKNKNKE